MGFYGDRVFPRVMNAMMDTKETRRIRERVCEPLRGDIVEVGFGTGHNLPFLPVSVTSVRVVDPLERGRDLAAERLAATSIPVTFVGLDGQRLPLEDDSADAVLCTWTLCSIPDGAAAVAEMRRVLRPGGTLLVADAPMRRRGLGWRLLAVVIGLGHMAGAGPRLEPLAAQAGFEEIHGGEAPPWLGYVRAVKSSNAA